VEWLAGEDVHGVDGEEVLVEVVEGLREGVVAEFVAVEGQEGAGADGFLGVGLESCGGLVHGWEQCVHEYLVHFVE